MRRWLLAMLSLVTYVLAAGALHVEAGRKDVPLTDRFRPAAAKIANQVFDLLEADVDLDTESDQLVWESERFDTSQFNKIGLRFSVETEQGAVTCAVCWQYGPDDEFLAGVPVVTLPSPLLQFQIMPGDFGRIRPAVPIVDPGTGPRRSDGIPDLYIQNPREGYPTGVYNPPNVDFSEVRGLGAKVRCTMVVFQELGDDPSLRDDEPSASPQTATLTDVKVLLRRE